MLGSFSATSYDGFQQTLLDGLVGLKNAGVTNLIVDVVSFISLSLGLRK